MRRFPFKTIDGEVSLPVSSDSEFFTDSKIYKYGNLNEIYFEFFQDEECLIPVTPTSGIIKSSASPMGDIYLDASSGSSINASDVSYPNGSYTSPIMDGLIEISRVQVEGIQGANYMKAVLYTHSN